ncbi:MAG: ABC transporter ATP-binding protein [Sporolactobacillus sp.]
MEETVLELNDVSKHFKAFALNHVSFSLKKGYIMGFIGANGAGKSTTIRSMLGLIHLDSGSIRMFGKDIQQHPEAIKERIGFVFDQDVFFGGLTGESNRRLLARFYKRWDDAQFNRYIQRFGVPLNKKMKQLSKGTKMKFALAAALSHHAELIIMDEPTSGLDPVFRRDLLDVLLEVIQEGDCAVFFSTHMTTDLERIADYVTFIRDGNIVFSLDSETLRERYTLIKGAAEAEGTVRLMRPVTVHRGPLSIEALAETAQIDTDHAVRMGLRLERPTLDDIMYYLSKVSDGAEARQ